MHTNRQPYTQIHEYRNKQTNRLHKQTQTNTRIHKHTHTIKQKQAQKYTKNGTINTYTQIEKNKHTLKATNKYRSKQTKIENETQKCTRAHRGSSFCKTNKTKAVNSRNALSRFIYGLEVVKQYAECRRLPKIQFICSRVGKLVNI